MSMFERNNEAERETFQGFWDEAHGRRGYFGVAGVTIHPRGVEHATMTIVARKWLPGIGTTIVVHEEGRKYFAGRGAQGYAPASYHVWLVEPRELGDEIDSWRYVDLADFTPPGNAAERRTGSIAHINYLKAEL